MAQYTFPADLSEFIDKAEIEDAILPVGIILLFEEEIDPETLGLPGTWGTL